MKPLEIRSAVNSLSESISGVIKLITSDRNFSDQRIETPYGTLVAEKHIPSGNGDNTNLVSKDPAVIASRLIMGQKGINVTMIGDDASVRYVRFTLVKESNKQDIPQTNRQEIDGILGM